MWQPAGQHISGQAQAQTEQLFQVPGSTGQKNCKWSRELRTRQVRSHPCSRLMQWSLHRRGSKAGEFNTTNATTALWAMALPLLGGRSCSAHSCIWLRLIATRLLKERTVTYVLMWQIYSVTPGHALHRPHDTDDSRWLPRSNLIKKGVITAIPTALLHLSYAWGNMLHSKLLAVPALLAFTLTEGNKDASIGPLL